MAALQATVKNTFLEVVVEQDAMGGLPRGRRCWSDFGELKEAEVVVFDSFSAALSEKIKLESTMQKVFSVTSLSTMVPDDLDCEGGSRNFRHGLVPKNVALATPTQDASPSLDAHSAATTLMLRNIPNRYSQDELIDELEGLGFLGTFDFFYAPVDVGSMFSVGYAFVNFVDAAWAARCQSTLDGYTFEKHLKSPTAKRRVATVSVAHLQGFEANMRHYVKAAVSKKARGTRRSGPVVMPVREDLVV